jgi:hypothetical protein
MQRPSLVVFQTPTPVSYTGTRVDGRHPRCAEVIERKLTWPQESYPVSSFQAHVRLPTAPVFLAETAMSDSQLASLALMRTVFAIFITYTPNVAILHC